jgi:hypothetical protein
LLDLSLRADPIAATPIKELPGRLFIRLGHMEITGNDDLQASSGWFMLQGSVPIPRSQSLLRN